MIATKNETRVSAEETHRTALPLPHGPARQALDLAVRRLDAAELERDPDEMSAALAGISRCYRALSAWAPAIDYMQQALRWTHAVGGVDQRVELLCELAELACSSAEACDAADSRDAHIARECARDRAFEAARMAIHAADAHWEIKVLLRASDVLDRCGDHDDAIALQTRVLRLISQHPDVAVDSAALVSAAPAQLM
jgi:tetratricopeptide (TPR) repeat protein